jgi:hypothetical protein
VCTVIAAHEHDVERIVRRTPSAKCFVERCNASRFRTQEITEHDEPRRARSLDQARETREIRRRRFARQRNARAQPGRLSEMHVGDEQCARFGPVQCALGVEHDTLAGNARLEQAARHAACGRGHESEEKGRHDGVKRLDARSFAAHNSADACSGWRRVMRHRRTDRPRCRVLPPT